MKLHLKITIGFLLLIQALHIALLQDSTNSPGRTIEKSWLREPLKPSLVTQMAEAEEHMSKEQELDRADTESRDDNTNGIASGSLYSSSGEDEAMINQEQDSNVTSHGETFVSANTFAIFPNNTTMEPELTDTTDSQTAPTKETTLSTQDNTTGAEEERHNTPTVLQNATAYPVTQTSTEVPGLSNGTEYHNTTLTPKANDTQVIENWATNNTEATPNVTSTEVPDVSKASTTTSYTTGFPSETTVDETTPVTMTTVSPSRPGEANLTDKGIASGSNSERGLASDLNKSKRSSTWGALLGTAAAVAFVALIIYVILKKRNRRDFSHRKLVEEFSPDPVLRLDNSEPLDLNYGGAAYHNPGLQMDDIQMTRFPGRQKN